MRSNEFIAEEIERIPAREFEGGSKFLSTNAGRENRKPLPNNSGLFYSMVANNLVAQIRIFDSLTTPVTIGQLILAPKKLGDLYGYEVDTITTHENYRGKGIGLALYGIVLSIMKKPLFAGSSQTPAGRLAWMKLNTIPGVDVKGWARLLDSVFDEDSDDLISTVMTLGGDYLGQSNGYRGVEHYFSFDVVPGNGELKPYLSKKLKLYKKDWREADSSLKTGLYATWTGN